MAIIRLTDIVTTMKDKWTYGDKFFGYTEEFNDNHNTQYPSLLITPPNSTYPEVSTRNGWEVYTFEVYFSDLYNRTQQENEDLEKRWDNLQDLGNEWLDRFLRAYQGGTTTLGNVLASLDDDSLVVERLKEVANDQLLQLKMTFNWRVFSICFTPVSIYPDQIDDLVVWLKADSGVTFDIPTKKVSAWADQSGNSNSVAQATSANHPLRYTYDGANDKTRFEFNGTTTALHSNNNCPITTNDFTIITVAKSETNTGGLTRRIFGYRDTTDDDRIIIGYSATNTLVAKVVDNTGKNIVVYGGAGELTTDYQIMTVYLTSNLLSLQYNQNTEVTGTTAGFDNVTGYDDDPFTIGSVASAAEGNYLDGNVQEVIVYNAAIPRADIAKIQDYLNRKYKIY